MRQQIPLCSIFLLTAVALVLPASASAQAAPTELTERQKLVRDEVNAQDPAVPAVRVNRDGEPDRGYLEQHELFCVQRHQPAMKPSSSGTAPPRRWISSMTRS